MLNTYQHDVLTELINIGIASGAKQLAEMMNTRVDMHVPQVTILPLSQLKDQFKGNEKSPVHVVRQSFSGGYKGMGLLVFNNKDINSLVSNLTNTNIESEEIAKVKSDVMKEVGNIVLNGVMTAFSKMLNTRFIFDSPADFEGDYSNLQQFLNNEWHDSQAIICKASFNLKYKEGIEGDIIILYESILQYLKAIKEKAEGR